MSDPRDIDLHEWYTAQEAAERLSANSGRTIVSAYVRQLARYGKAATTKIGNVTFYRKSDIDGYVVGHRGAWMQQVAKERKQEGDHAA